MFDKKGDTFFDDNNGVDEASDQLLQMINNSSQKPIIEVTPGSKVEGTVTRIGTEYVYVDIGSKNEALLKLKELSNKKDSVTIAIGDKISAYVISNDSNETIISKSMGNHSASKSELFQALNDKIPVQGKVTGVSKDGLTVKIMGQRAFCPISQIDIKFTDDVNIFLGKTFDFIITRITEGGRNVVVSRIPLIEMELSEKLELLSSAIDTHACLRGKISRITDFGLFVDVGSLDGLVHISEISWERADNLNESFRVGQDVEFIILKLEKKEPLRNSKISLSIKQILDNPWNSVTTQFSPGQSIQGKVTRLTHFGAFVEIAPGIEGLIHISEMSWGKRVNHPSEIVSEGMLVTVNVLSIDEHKKSISLSLKDVADDPWRDVKESFPIGSAVEGTIVKKAQFGYFIELKEGVTGLLVFSNIVSDKKESIKEHDAITVVVESVDKIHRRISLSYGLKESRINTQEVKDFLSKSTKKSPGSDKSSTEFGAALLAALKK